ncbi:MAG TPA: glycosyltransferase family 2 protein [Gemmatimonadales bacterium]|nr:glycosyltransferase family 2 protein [Gemmatimonadales bacterium]
MRGHPLVSVGVPVYNAERFLARALDSLLGQTLSDFELIISDNASADGTAGICEQYARADRRVRYVRQARNIGAARNWNVVAREARGVFFKWASGNDTCAPTMLEQCVRALQADPGVVLCYGRTELVDERDQPIERYAGDLAFEEERAAERFERVCSEMALNNAQCGVMRRDALRRTALDRPFAAGDVALMAELALYGKFRLLPEVLLYRRQSPGAFSLLLSPLERRRFHDPQAKAPMKLFRVRHHVDHLRSIARAPLPAREKLRVLGTALRLARWDRVHIWRELRSLLGGAPAAG